MKQDVVAAIGQRIVCDDLADARHGREGWLAVMTFPSGLQGPHGDESIFAEGVLEHLAVPRFKQMQRKYRAGKEHHVWQRENGNLPGEVLGPQAGPLVFHRHVSFPFDFDRMISIRHARGSQDGRPNWEEAIWHRRTETCRCRVASRQAVETIDDGREVAGRR
jgi:hypothetical protein